MALSWIQSKWEGRIAMELRKLRASTCSHNDMMMKDRCDISVRKTGAVMVVQEAMLSYQPILGIQSDKLL